MNGSNNEARTIYYLCTATISCVYLAILWTLPNDWFNDRNYYYIYADQADLLIETSTTSWIFGEQIFLRVAKFFGDNSIADSFSPFMSVFVTAILLIILSKHSKTFIMFFLGFISLLVVTYLQAIQLMVLRQGVSTAIFLWVFLNFKDDKKKLIACAFLSLFHSVFFIITAVYAAYIFYLKRKNTLTILMQVGIVSSIFYLASNFIMGYVGVRQAGEYMGVEGSGGGGAFIVALFTLIYIYFFGNKENKDLYNWSIIGLVLFITGYFLFFSPGRLFMSFYPFILILLVMKSRLQDILFLSATNIIYLVLLINGSYMSLIAYSNDQYFLELLCQHIRSLNNIF